MIRLTLQTQFVPTSRLEMSGIFRFRVGVRPLSAFGGKILASADVTHAAFLINRDLFEYGNNGTKENSSWTRQRDVGRDEQFDWDEVGEALSGTTKVSPDMLEERIRNSG